MNKLRFVAVIAVMVSAILAVPGAQGQDPYGNLVGRALREDRQLDSASKACKAAGNNPRAPACQQAEKLTQQMRAKTKAMRRQTKRMEGQVRSEEIRNGVNASQRQQQDRKSAFQYQQDANYWRARERSAREAGNRWEAETARRNAEYNRQKAKEYGWR